MAVPGKQYGLILPQKKAVTKTATLQRASVFGDDSDEETSVGESLQKEAVKKRMMKQTRLEMQKALEEDSTVYDYDGVYEDIQNQRLESSKKILGGKDRKPKYINQLMKAVEERKKEQERRDERKIQKEREAEGEEFADKDAYVTSAYRQKLKERQEEQEKEKREAAMEAALDVKKQKDLSGFYRHLLNQTVGEEAIPDHTTDGSSSALPTATDTTSAAPLSPSRDNGTSLHSDSEDGRESKPGFSKPGHSSGHSKRHYRQRSPSPGSGDERGREKVKERDRHKKSQRDGERDRDRRKERDGERDDRHRGRRDDKDRRKDRGERESGQHRGREERGKEDRQERREKSPKVRGRDDDDEEEKRRGKRGSLLEQQQQEEQKERMKDSEKETANKPEATDKEGRREETQKGSSEKQGSDGSPQGEEKASKFAKRSSDHTVSSARERYLARQIARSASKAYIEKEED
ncbi:unnamed protein product [Merluccius merluccius]